MLEFIKEMLREIEEDEELLPLMARALKKMHSALTEVGFTEEQATTIIAGQGIGLKQSQ